MDLYRKFRASSLDTAPLGLWTGADTSENVFTPTGSRVVAWCGEGGSHFCQTEGFGDMVFAVDPCAPPGDQVHPVAATLSDFIGLLTLCRHGDLILNAYRMSRYLFEHRVAGIVLSYKTRSVLRALENTYHPTKPTDAYTYMTELQKRFDYTVLPLHPDYFEWCPIRPGALRWDVGFNTGFSEFCDRKQAGQELSVRRSFRWGEELWQIPAVYLCEDGIVVDQILEVPRESLETFSRKWSVRPDDELSQEEKLRRDMEYPLSRGATGTLVVNEKMIPCRQSTTVLWDPTRENPWNARRTLEHYGLDRDRGYLIRRQRFPRKSKNPPIRTMEIKLEADPVTIPGQRFVAPRAGEQVQFIDPFTGRVHSLTTVSLTREALDPNFLSDHPCCYTRLTFSLDPAIPKEQFHLTDCDPGDPFPMDPNDPAAMLFSGKIPAAGHTALSSLRYTPAQSVTWRMTFCRKPRQDTTVRLLP
ncbi:MAG: hypothetical protein II290_08850 [Oscillospiraceae bacterium]|nr:hypothetical protein [Oscillospiraceae bacterium]